MATIADEQDKIRQLKARLTPEQAAMIEATEEEAETLAELEREEPITSLAGLKAVTRINLPVYADRPNRLRVGYLPVVASDPRVMAQMLRVMGIAARLKEYGTKLQAAGNAINEEDVTGDKVEDLLSVEKFESLMDEYKAGLTDYLLVVCPEWSLKDPWEREYLLAECPTSILQDIFQATRQYGARKNGSG